MENLAKKISNPTLRRAFLVGWQFFKFGVVGLSNTAISLTIYYLFIYIDKDYYMLGNVIGWIISVCNAFYWSNKYVFKLDDNSWKQRIKRLLRTYMTYGGTFLLSTGLLYFQVQIWHVSEWMAPLVNLLITIPLNFMLNKFWAFKQ